MLLMHYQETLWLADVGGVVETPPHRGLFAGRQLAGRNWLAQLPAEDRRIFSELGRRASSERGINWHRLGGLARARAPLRNPDGTFMAEPHW